MLKKLIALAVVAFLLYGGYRLVSGGFSLHRAAQTLDDDSITAEVLGKIAKEKPAALLSVKVSTKEGRVLLRGRVLREKDRLEMEKLARAADGAKSVSNQLAVDWHLTVPQDLVNDLKISSSIKEKLIREEGLRGLNIHVSVEKGNVLLTGKVPSSEQATLAKQIAESTPGVRKVENRIRIQ